MPIRNAFRDQRLQFVELTRLFFGRFLENDLIAIDGDARATLVGILSLLVAPGVFLPLLEYLQFSSYPLGFQPLAVRDMAAIPDKTLAIALSMTVLGLFTVFEWDAVFPDRRDIAVLRPMPIGIRMLFAGKLAALAQFWLVLTLAVNGFSSFLFPMAIVQRDSSALPRYIGCHVLAILAANAFMFLAMIAIQGILVAALGWARFRRVAPYAQFVLIVAILGMFFLSIGAAFGLRPYAPPPPLISALPVFWFLGQYQTQLGGGLPLFNELAAYALPAIGIAAAVAAAAYALSYRRSVSRSFEEQDGPARKPGPVGDSLAALANRVLLRTPAQRAAFHFIWQTVMRSRSHRVLIAAWAGSGFALVFQGITGSIAGGVHNWWRTPSGPLLPATIVLPLFLITGLRYAFSVPADLRSNWIFQAASISEPADYLAGARKAALLLSVAPLFALLTPVFIAIWGWTTGGLHVLSGAVMAWLLAEIQLVGLEKLPFTCSYVAGKANLKTWWTLYVLGYIGYVAALSWLDLEILKRPPLIIPFLAAAALALAALDGHRRRRPPRPGLFDERPEPVVRTLGLQE
jgi:hypothetical protein